jgi:hypothetical protein
LTGGVDDWVAAVFAVDFPNPLNRLVEPVAALPNALPGVALGVVLPNKLGVDVGADEVAVFNELKERVGCGVGAEVAGVDPNKLLL